MNRNKNKPNAFYFFMLDWKKQEERKGQRFPRGLKDVQMDPSCNQAWSNLTSERKHFYKEKAKNEMIQPKCYKKTSVGENFEEILAAEIREKKFLDNMMEHISFSIKRAKKDNCVQTLKFHVIHVNYFYMRVNEGETEYYPAEIGIAEFSLEKGIIRTYHKIVNSEIKMGYTYEAKQYSSNTHQIPRNPEFGESDYSIIFEEICDFLKQGNMDNKLPPVYTLYDVENIKHPVVNVLETLSGSANSSKHILVYSFEELFVALHNLNSDVGIKELNLPIVSIKLKQDPYDFTTNIQCEYHMRSPGGNHCSISLIQRWIFVLCTECCDLFDINLQPGCHIPLEKTVTDTNSDLQHSFSSLSFNSSTSSGKISTSTGVVKNPIKHVSERNFEDERRRRNESKPLNIIFHGNFLGSSEDLANTSEKSPNPPPSRPQQVQQPSAIDLSEDNFPSIGRGAMIRSRLRQNDKTKTNWASHLK